MWESTQHTTFPIDSAKMSSVCGLLSSVAVLSKKVLKHSSKMMRPKSKTERMWLAELNGSFRRLLIDWNTPDGSFLPTPYLLGKHVKIVFLSRIHIHSWSTMTARGTLQISSLQCLHPCSSSSLVCPSIYRFVPSFLSGHTHCQPSMLSTFSLHVAQVGVLLCSVVPVPLGDKASWGDGAVDVAWLLVATESRDSFNCRPEIRNLLCAVSGFSSLTSVSRFSNAFFHFKNLKCGLGSGLNSNLWENLCSVKR